MRNNKKIRRNPKPMSLETLISEIKSLEEDEIISFNEFKEIPIHEIRGDYFPMVNTRTIDKALTKIEYEKTGNNRLSSYTIVTETYKEDKVFIEKRTDSF